MYKLHTACRACGYGAKLTADGIKSGAQTEKLVPVFDLGTQPLANDFRRAEYEHEGSAPLSVLYCPRCSLAQLSVVVDPRILYAHNYPYVTSRSDTMQQHFAALIKDIFTETSLRGCCLEIGSNDGFFLQTIKDAGMKQVLGIEPANNLSAIANKNGVRTVTGFFGTGCNGIPHSKPDIIVARHVFCHVDDWRGFIKELEAFTHPKSLVCIEVPYAKDMIENLSFDQIYHEHLSYMTVEGMAALMVGSQFHFHRIVRYPIHGGAILFMLRRNESSAPPHRSVTDHLDLEHITKEAWEVFSKKSDNLIWELRKLVNELHQQGKTIAGYGASAKSTVWVNACEFTRKQIQFITDTTPAKQWTFSPGSDIPITDPGAILRELPDYVIVFAWNFWEEIIAKEERARAKGVKFIRPLPTIEIV